MLSSSMAGLRIIMLGCSPKRKETCHLLCYFQFSLGFISALSLAFPGFFSTDAELLFCFFHLGHPSARRVFEPCATFKKLQTQGYSEAKICSALSSCLYSKVRLNRPSSGLRRPRSKIRDFYSSRRRRPQ